MEQGSYGTENPQILGATLSNLVATTTWHMRFVHPCLTVSLTTLWFEVAAESVEIYLGRLQSRWPRFKPDASGIAVASCVT